MSQERLGRTGGQALVTDQAGLARWLGAVAREGSCIVPGKTAGGQVDWIELKGDGLPLLEAGLPRRPLKTFLLPQPEILFTFDARDQRLEEPDEAPVPLVLAGVRPCDARSIILEAIPHEGDPYFERRLEALTIIGFPCRKGCSTCFCQWVGSGPASTEGMDVAVWAIEGSFVIEALTGKGEALIDMAEDFEPASQKAFEEIGTWRQKTGQGEDTASALRAKELMALYDAPFWQQVADCCLNCGTCTFLCPTCYCFDIQDERTGVNGRRIRYWDSCMFPLFTQHASGHNPRGTPMHRVRNRFMHKFKYYPDRFGPISCVGCGRCINQCPVNIDIREVLRDLLAI